MSSTIVKVADLLKKIQNDNIQFIDFRFTDMLGKSHHISFRPSAIDESHWTSGIMFDGSSIAGWKPIHQSDMMLKPDLSTAFLDPFTSQSTLVIICDIIDIETNRCYDRDPRAIANKAQLYLNESGIGDYAYFGPELEFFIFDDVKFTNQPHNTGFTIDCSEGSYNSGRDYESGNLGHRPGRKAGYFPVPPVDSLNDIRAEIVLALESVGLKAGLHHHEVAEGQCEVGFNYGLAIESADNVQKFKYVVRNLAESYGKTATFMPKPLFEDNGSGMHIHQSIWKESNNLFYNKGDYANLSEMCLYYIGGIIKHAKAINAFTNPTTNSYKRLVPGFEAPVQLAYSEKNRSAAIRIPYVQSANAKRIEVRFPDPTANPYLAFAALLMAGIDGIKNKIHPSSPHDQDLYQLSGEEAKNIPQVALSLRQALEALDKDREFLKQGNVFTDDMIDAYIKLKMPEVLALEMHPHPIEFKMYYSS